MEFKRNIIGNNIRALREQHGETLQDLANAIFVSASAVKNYETGYRSVDLEKIQAIAAHYGRTVDEILGLNLEGLSEMGNLGSWSDMIEKMNVIMPVISSEEALKNDSFKKGHESIQKMIEKVRHCQNPSQRDIEICFNELEKALEHRVDEAAANLLWLIFVVWNSISNINNMEMVNSLMANKGNDTEYIKKIRLAQYVENTSIGQNQMLKEFVNDNNDSIFFYIRILKESEAYKGLGDYYLSMKYIVGMVDNDYTRALNRQIGMEMIFANISVGNEYAFKFLQESLR